MFPAHEMHTHRAQKEECNAMQMGRNVRLSNIGILILLICMFGCTELRLIARIRICLEDLFVESVEKKSMDFKASRCMSLFPSYSFTSDVSS